VRSEARNGDDMPVRGCGGGRHAAGDTLNATPHWLATSKDVSHATGKEDGAAALTPRRK
jgi:hypothetical protein